MTYAPRASFPLFCALCGLLLLPGLPSPASAAQGQKAEDHFKSAMSFYKANNAKAALEELDLALKATPQNDTPDSKKNTALLLSWIGFIHLVNQHFDQAREPLEKAVALEPDNIKAHISLGNVYNGLKLDAKAVEEFETVTKLQPDYVDAYYNLGVIYSNMRQWPRAVEALRKAARYNIAAVNASKAVPPRPNQPVVKEDPYIHDSLGIALQNNNSLSEAVAEFQKALLLEPRSAEFNFHLAEAWRQMAEKGKGDRENALRSARRAFAAAVESAPTNYEMREIYAETLFEMKLYPEAAREFEKAAELDRSKYSPLYNLGLTYSLLNSPAASERFYAKALAAIKEGDDPARRRDALNGLGLAQYKQGKFAQAIETLKQVTKDFPTDTTGWINLAASLRGSKDEPGEIDALKGAIANSPPGPGTASLHATLGALYLRRGDTENALDQYTQANELKPNTAETLYGLGLVEQKKGDLEGAIKHLLAAVQINPKFADAYNDLGVAYEARKKQGDMELAYASYEKALSINPNHVLAKQNKERFDKAKKGN